MYPSNNALLHAYADPYFFSSASAAATAVDINIPSPIFPNIPRNHLFLPHHDDHDATLLPYFLTTSTNTATNHPNGATVAAPTAKGAAAIRGGGMASNPGRNKPRSGKKDRHSKICTARGPRDRRMRLSLDIARAFFDLQDLLGFDKASKTVGWLLEKSKAAIKDLKRGSSAAKAKLISKCGKTTTSSTSEGEATSGVDETINTTDNNDSNAADDLPHNKLEKVPKGKKTKASRKSTFDPLAKESRAASRAMARARARERTKEKLWEKRLEKESDPSHGSVVEKKSPKSLEAATGAEVREEPSSQSPESGGPSSIFDYHHHHHGRHGVSGSSQSSQGVINTDPLVSLHNNDMINFFRHNWDQINTSGEQSNYGAIPDTQLNTNMDHVVHERPAACPPLVFGSPADIRHHQPPHFLEPHQTFVVKPWEGY